jgi:Protein of unknown function (DUF4238)
MNDENQHWVPKFLIKNFAAGDGRVFRFDTHTGEVTKPPPRRAASDFRFNEFVIKGEEVSFEDRLEKVETRAAPILKRIITSRSLAGLTVRERVRVANFVAAQSFRTEAFYKGFTDQPMRQDFGQTFEELWRCAFVVADGIANRHWTLMMIQSDDVFYLGDNPVVLQRTENPKDGSSLGFDVKGVEAFLPLSPKCALYMPCRSVSDEIIARYENALILHRAVRSAVMRGYHGGAAELRAAQMTILRTHSLYEAFTKGVPFTADEPHVQNLNYLQCSWAHSGVYSDRKDFVFAQRVFRENPQYRSVPCTSALQMGTILVPVE